MGLVLGLTSGILAVRIGILGGSLAALVIIVLSIMVPPRFAALAGAAGGIGAFWLYGTIDTAAKCQGTPDYCGNANLMPLLSVSLAALAVSMLAAVATIRRQRQ